MEQYNLFVYGSLRPNFFNFEKYLEGKTLDIKPAVLKNMDLYHMPYKGYPAITKGTGVVVGEIITVKDDNLLLKDKLYVSKIDIPVFFKHVIEESENFTDRQFLKEVLDNV